jgi:hypothetical protein
MKPLMLKIIFISLILFGLNGCYTIIWSPDMEFPTQDNSASTTIYYGDTYYGSYYYFYDYPWWLDIAPPVATPFAGERSDNHETNILRNTGERGTPPRIPDVQPPSRDAPPTNTDNNGNSNNSGSTTTTETSARNSSSSSATTNSRESSSGSGNTVRNNNGGRNAGGRK